MFGSDLEHRVWSRFWNWNLANILRLVLTWDLTIFGNTIGNKDRGEVIPRTWFHSFFSRKKSEIWIAFTFFEKWKVKNKIPSLFFEKWKWNWNGSRSRTRSENEKKFSRILEKRESRWSLPMATWNGHFRSKNWFQQFSLDVCYPVPALFQPVPPVQSRHGRLRPEHCIYGHFWLFLAIKWVKMAGTRNTCFGSRSRSTQMTT